MPGQLPEAVQFGCHVFTFLLQETVADQCSTRESGSLLTEPARLDLQLYAGLTITGAVGTVYSIEHVTDLAQTNNASAWRCLEFLQLPASPYLWADKSAPATGKRF